jgi:hypothetical protein
LWVCSWQRSGSTWLAEMVASSSRTRLVYEPANLFDQTFTGPDAAHHELPVGDGQAVADVIAALDGRLHGAWVDQINRAHLVERTVVKDVRAISIAGDVIAARPDTPVVVLTRHPIAVARSVVDLGWTSEADQRAAFLAEVESWCVHHRRALGDDRLAAATFVTYEALREDPRRRVREILEWAATFDPIWRPGTLAEIDPARPSSTDFRGRSTSTETGWLGLAEDLVDEAVALIDRHGLSALYGREERALGELADVAASLRSLQR